MSDVNANALKNSHSPHTPSPDSKSCVSTSRCPPSADLHPSLHCHPWLPAAADEVASPVAESSNGILGPRCSEDQAGIARSGGEKRVTTRANAALGRNAIRTAQAAVVAGTARSVTFTRAGNVGEVVALTQQQLPPARVKMEAEACRTSR